MSEENTATAEVQTEEAPNSIPPVAPEEQQAVDDAARKENTPETTEDAIRRKNRREY